MTHSFLRSLFALPLFLALRVSEAQANAEKKEPSTGGVEHRIANQVAIQYPMAVSVSADGSRILVKTATQESEKLAVIDRVTKRIVAETESTDAHLALSWSSNRNEIAYLAAQGNGDNYHAFLWNTNEQHPIPLDGPPTNTAIQSIRWSPNGDTLAYLVGNNADAAIWIVSPHTARRPRALAVHIRPLSDFEWSPDGNSMAAVPSNNPSAVEIISTDDGHILDAFHVGTPQSEIRDLSWAPSGHTLALAARVQSDFLDLLKLDLQSRSVSTCASAHGDILAPHFASDSQSIIYSFSQNSEVSLFATRCQPAKPMRVWSRSGTVRFLKLVPKSASPSVSIDSLFVLHNSLNRPAQIYKIPLGPSETELVYAPPGSSQLKSSSPDVVEVGSSDGTQIPTVFWRAVDQAPPTDVVVIDVHGGPRLQQYRRWELLPMILTGAGVDVLSPNYRGSRGYGYNFETITDAGAQTKDIVAVCKYAKSLHGGKAKVVLIGTSYGAFLAASAALSDPGDVSGLVLVSMIARNVDHAPGTPWKLPIFCFHGENDPLPPDRAKVLLESFLGTNVLQIQQSRWRVFGQEGHVFRRAGSWAEVYGSVLTMCENARHANLTLAR